MYISDLFEVPNFDVTSAQGAQLGTEMIDYSSADPSLSLDLGKLFSDATDADVTIVVGDEKFKAHKVLLKARSDYFRALFESNMEESRKNEVGISNFGILIDPFSDDPFWAAAPKRTKSCGTQGTFVCLSVRAFIPPRPSQA